MATKAESGQEYSRGFHSGVYFLTPDQKRKFPQADLVKIERINEENWYLRWYLNIG